jgi:hypothetical protein
MMRTLEWLAKRLHLGCWAYAHHLLWRARRLQVDNNKNSVKILNMNRMLLATLVIGLGCAGCDKDLSERSDTFGIGSNVPQCPLESFYSLPSFSAKVVFKEKWSLYDKKTGNTNLMVAFVLEKISGEKLAVISRNASTNMIKVLESIKANTIYEMPSALKTSAH